MKFMCLCTSVVSMCGVCAHVYAHLPMETRTPRSLVYHALLCLIPYAFDPGASLAIAVLLCLPPQCLG